MAGKVWNEKSTMLMYHSLDTCEGKCKEEEKERKAGEVKHETGMLHMHKTGEFFSVPVQYQVWGKDEFARVVDGPPDEPDHQDLQPGALQEFYLIMKRQLHKTYKEGLSNNHTLLLQCSH